MEKTTSEHLNRILATDQHYQVLLKNCLNTESDYLRIINSLSSEDRDIIEHYLTACEELDHRRLTLALEM